MLRNEIISQALLDPDERASIGLPVAQDAVLPVVVELNLQYRHHLEACYCLEGEAELTDLASGETHAIRPGTIYALDQHDRHTLRAKTDLHLVCVFNPALTGGETHDADGSFPPPVD